MNLFDETWKYVQIKYHFSTLNWQRKWKPLRIEDNPDGKIHGANMGPTWVLSAPGGPHDSPMNLAIRERPI